MSNPARIDTIRYMVRVGLSRRQIANILKRLSEAKPEEIRFVADEFEQTWQDKRRSAQLAGKTHHVNELTHMINRLNDGQKEST